MNLGIIPARGGSKRIPGKNTKLFAGKPLTAYSPLNMSAVFMLLRPFTGGTFNLRVVKANDE